MTDSLRHLRRLVALASLLVILKPATLALASDATRVKRKKKIITTEQQKKIIVKDRDISEYQDDRAIKDFDTIRQYFSYDPATDVWSPIEDFDAVELLEDLEAKREGKFLYYSFWAYDAQADKWQKVNIWDHGYKYPQTPEEASQHKKRKKLTWKVFFRNLAINISAGSGGTYFRNDVQGLKLIRRDTELFLQGEAGSKANGAYKLGWFHSPYTKVKDLNMGLRHKGLQSVSSKSIQFQGVGFSIPITLTTHLTIWDRFRIGLGSVLDINCLKKLTLKAPKQRTPAPKLRIEKPWFFHLKWFGTAGVIIWNQPKGLWLVDAQVGPISNIGGSMGRFWDTKEILGTAWSYNLGIGYERRLNDYFKLSTRLAGDWRRFTDKHDFIQAAGASVKLSQFALQLQAGISCSFGRNKLTKRKDSKTQASKGRSSSSRKGPRNSSTRLRK